MISVLLKMVPLSLPVQLMAIQLQPSLGSRCATFFAIINKLLQDGQPLPNDGRYVPSDSNGSYKLSLANTLAQDAGIYECVAKNPAGEAR